jgi:hypothetical protein
MGSRSRSNARISSADVERAAELYREFREDEPRHARVLEVELPGAVAEVGVCQFIGYETTHAGKATAYVHGFVAGSRPRLYASGRRGELFLFGGRFRMTSRGIVDLMPDGREARELTTAQLRALLKLEA